MNRSALKGASATVALLVGLGLGDPAWAAGPREADPAIQRVRQHVQGLKQVHKAKVAKAKPAKPAKAVAAKAEAKLKPGVRLASYTAEELAEEVEDEAEDSLAEDQVFEVPVEAEPGDEPAPLAAAPQPEPAEPAQVQPVQAQAEPATPEPAQPAPAQPAPAMAEPAVAAAPPAPPPPAAEPPAPAAVAVQQPPQPAPQPQQQVQAQAEVRQQVDASAEVPPAQEMPGVLTRRGTLVVEPSIEYSHSDVNQFAFNGVAIVNAVLFGSIAAQQADRDTVTATLGMRYGITNRLEGELRVPYMYRSDTTNNTYINQAGDTERISSDGHGLGDVEGALHYQLNDGIGKWPVFVANFRAKSTTGSSPYDVDRSPQGVEEELSTGSGFWGFEPSLTVIAPSDPAVFFANVGYLWNVKDDVNKQIGNRTVTSVDPGDAIRFGVGMGLALNEKVSFSVGYQHDWILGTKTKFDIGEAKSDALSVGSLSFGVNYQMSDNAALNVSVGVGVTEDAPDVRLMARVPISISLF